MPAPDESNIPHPATPQRYLLFPTTWHTAFEAGYLGQCELTDFSLWDEEGKKAWKHGYAEGKQARQNRTPPD